MVLRLWTNMLLLIVLIVAAGCGQMETAEVQHDEKRPAAISIETEKVEAETLPDYAADTTPVTLDFAVHLPINEEFERLYIEPVTKKYPHITLNMERVSNFAKYDELLAAGQVPDLYISFNGNMPGLKDRGINMDMKDIFEQQGFDLSRFQQNYLDDIQYAAVEEGELYGLPIETAFHALYYNKDIFDQFGVAYPKDGMTMEEALELARQLTRVVDGVQYRGWDIASIVRLAQPLGLEYVDHDTELAIVASEGWKRVFELGKAIYSIPGNAPSEDASKNRLNGFMTDRTIAMLNETSKFSQLKEAEQNGLNWDVAQHPYYEERPNVYGNSTVYMIGAVPTTEHMNQVLQVIEVFTSDEVQMEVSKSGRLSPLNNADVQNAFGQGDPALANKNLAGILKGTPVKYPIYLYREIAEPMTNRKFNEFLESSKDVNMVLKELEEEINLAIESEKR